MQPTVNHVWKNARCLYNQAQVDSAIDRMADEITAHMSDQSPLVLCVMNGGLIFTGHLLTRLAFPLEIDYLHATRYQGEIKGQDIIQWLAHPRNSVQDRHVLLVDDILDQGHTLLAVIKDLHRQGAKSVRTAVLVDKQHTRKADPNLKADYTGLYTPDHFLFGYGMDYQGYLRNAPGIYASYLH